MSSPSPPTTPQKRSAGEELFLVHLRRQNSPHHDHQDDEDDHDYPEPRKRSKSIGEELFEVHLKRSEGGCEEPDAVDGAKQDEGTGASEEASGPKKTTKDGDDARASDGGMHLRDGRVISHFAQ